MAKKTVDEVYEKHFRRIVKEGGGEWVGIQEVEHEDYDLVLFSSPKTGSTLAVKTSACDANAVAVKLALHEDKWSQCN